MKLGNIKLDENDAKVIIKELKEASERLTNKDAEEKFKTVEDK